MRRQKRRPMHYNAFSLYDGTVLASYPIRKPTPKAIKYDKLRIDEDGVSKEWLETGKEFFDRNNSIRTRFQDIVSIRLNTRRTIREIVLPELVGLREELQVLQNQMKRIEQLLTGISPKPAEI